MKSIIKNAFLFLIVGSLAITSCSDDDDDNVKNEKPVITNLELGSSHDNPKEAVGYLGKDIHVAADIVAKNKIAKVIVEIHHEHDHGARMEEKEWEFTKEFPSYVGQVNAMFHQHIDVPSDIEEGEYHFHLKVVDKEGLSTVVEKELVIKKVAENKDIVITNFELGADHDNPNEAVGYLGKDIHVAADIVAKNEIAKVMVEIHHEHEHDHGAREEGKEWEFTKEFPSYVGKMKVMFHEHIDVPSDIEEGEYHFHLKVVDKKGVSKVVEKELIIKKK